MAAHRNAFSPRFRRGRAWLAIGGMLCALLAAGCQALHGPIAEPPPFGFVPVGPLANPIEVPVMDRDLLWEQVVDVVDDYFRIDREERPKLIGDIATEGRIDTYPRGGSTLLEPWNGDSADLYERLESTLQSIRRTATVRVIPTPAGYAIEVLVLKELEDVPLPETGTVSQLNSQALRNDSVVPRVNSPVAAVPPTIGWIDKGRDLALEQMMLRQIQARLAGPGPQILVR
jgi:hypothetical protein